MEHIPMPYDDPERLRLRADEDDADRSRVPDAAAVGAPRKSAVTATVKRYPTSASAFYAVREVQLGGPEIEGGAGTSTTLKPIFYAFNLGAAIPPNGTPVEITWIGHRWTFAYGGSCNG